MIASQRTRETEIMNEEEGNLFAGLSFPTVPTTSIMLPKLQDDSVVSILHPTALELTPLKKDKTEAVDHEDLETTSLLQPESVTLREESVEIKKKAGKLATLYATEVCLLPKSFSHGVIRT